mmetsp:Transcript_8619/g.25928  ORF Transcript_8619/g.25928 Transcript_8619/m.25928 type:complete len:232 (-) Transcript_8619:72-767(-)
MKFLVIGGSGNLGAAIAKRAVANGDDVSVVVRDASKVKVDGVQIFTGDAGDAKFLATVLGGGFEAVALAFGAQYADVVRTVIKAVEALPDDPDKKQKRPALLTIGGSPALRVLEEKQTAVDVAFGGEAWAKQLADLHLNVTFAALQASKLKWWTMVCPGTMVASEDGEVHHNHGIRPEIVDPDVAKDQHLYEDVAQAFVSVAMELRSGVPHYCQKRVAFTKPDVNVGAIRY